MNENKNGNKNGSRNVKKKKGSGIGFFINMTGITLLVVMLTFVTVNFMRDARIFQKPLLTSDSGKKTSAADNGSGNTETTESLNGTIKYSKPDVSSSSGKSSSKRNKSSNTGKKAAPTPSPTPQP